MSSLLLHSLPLPLNQQQRRQQQQHMLPLQQQPQLLMQPMQARLWGNSNKALQQETLRDGLMGPARAAGGAGWGAKASWRAQAE